MIGILLANWRYVVMVVLLAACAFYRWDAARWEKKYYTFEASVKAVGEAQNKASAETAKRDLKRKEIADAENATNVAKLATLTERLRLERAGRSYLSAPAPGAASPDTITLKRADTERAIRDFVEEAGGLIAEGDRALVDLDTAKRWAQR